MVPKFRRRQPALAIQDRQVRTVQLPLLRTEPNLVCLFGGKDTQRADRDNQHELHDAFGFLRSLNQI
ncbi:MAG: hypothetical protein ABWY27_11500 [Telluria sp.]